MTKEEQRAKKRQYQTDFRVFRRDEYRLYHRQWAWNKRHPGGAMQERDPTRRPYKCEEGCRNTYATVEGLCNHVRRIHEGKKSTMEIESKDARNVDLLARTVKCPHFHANGAPCKATFRPETAAYYLREHERRFHE